MKKNPLVWLFIELASCAYLIWELFESVMNINSTER